MRGVKSGNLHLFLSISNTYEPTLRDLQEVFGGSLHGYQQAKTHWKKRWQWMLSSYAAMEFLSLIAPYVRIKREQVGTALQFQALKRQVRKGESKFLPASNLEQRQALLAQLQSLNRRGVSHEEPVSAMA